MERMMIKMTGRLEMLYWRTNKNWYEYNEKTEEFYLTDSATKRAKKSYALWNGQQNDNNLKTAQIVTFAMANYHL